MMNTRLADAKTTMSPIVSANNAMSSAELLVTRLKNVVDRLCGAVPEAVGESRAVDPSGPLLPSLDANARSLNEAIADGESALNRLENLLP